MKKFCFSFLFIVGFLMGIYENALSQNNIKDSTKNPAWTTINPFHTDVFIQNYGQFESWVKSSAPIKYAINSTDKVFFTSQGLVYRIDKGELLSKVHKDGDNPNEEKEEHGKIETYFINMTWVGCNPNATVEVSDQTEGYYTYGQKGYENIKANGYKKLVYKDLYPGIDVEYTIPEKGGLKYKIIASGGADVSLIKMRYSGDVSKLKKDADGNVLIKTPIGNIIDHAPLSSYANDHASLQSDFEVKGKDVSFRMAATLDRQKAFVIDPLTFIPASLTTDNAAYDIDDDDHGFVYVSGGTYPLKIAKYTSAGSFVWVYTNPATWGDFGGGAYSYSRFCILPQSGTIFNGEGCDYTVGPQIMKINTSGNVVYTSPNLTGNEEIWVMFYNRCSAQLIAFGGCTTNTNDIQILSDTNITGNNAICFNNNTFTHNDITSAVMDYNGDFYTIVSSTYASTPQLMKSLYSTNYSPPPAFNINVPLGLDEFYNSGIPGFSTTLMYTVRANSLALNNTYLFTYDGLNLTAWDKTNGTQLGTIVVNASYAQGQYRTHEGIAADDCDNVYVGGTNMVHVFSFNGTTFIPSSTITTNGEVYGVTLNRSTSLLYISGQGFATVTAVAPCGTTNVLNVTDSVNNCAGNACIYVTGGTPPYTYTWSSGQTTNCVSNLTSGTYIVTISDHSCILQLSTDTIVINGNVNINISGSPTICPGGSTQLTAAGATTYSWSPAAGLSTTTGPTVIASPATTTTYTVTGMDGGCTGAANVTVNIASNLSPDLGPDTTLCSIPSYTLNAGYPGSIYLWSTTDTTQTISVTTDGTYIVSVNSNGCTGADTVTVLFDVAPHADLGPDTTICGAGSLLLDAGNPGSSYLWSTGDSTQTITVQTSNTYWVVVSNGSCHDTDTIQVRFATIPNVNLGNDTNLCTGNSCNLDACNPGCTYLWSTGATTQTLHVTTTGNYSVLVSNAFCSSSDTIHVAIQPLTVNLGNDVVLCNSSPYLLDACNPGCSYAWSTGDSTQTIAITTSGTYWVSVSNPICSGSDTINVQFSHPPTVFIGNDTILCPGASITLDAANPGAAYLWSTGATTHNITVGSQGDYSVSVTANGCTGVDSIYITKVVPFDLGQDRSLCDKPEYVLSTDVAASSYLWSTGDTIPSITVNQAGVYWLMIDVHNCFLADTVNITGGPTSFWIPSAFTPNNNGLNDVFMPSGEGINYFNLKIFTRWGEKIFETSDMTQGWDGRFKGTPVQMDLYVYVLDYQTICTGDRVIRKFGTVMVMR